MSPPPAPPTQAQPSVQECGRQPHPSGDSVQRGVPSIRQRNSAADAAVAGAGADRRKPSLLDRRGRTALG